MLCTCVWVQRHSLESGKSIIGGYIFNKEWLPIPVRTHCQWLLCNGWGLEVLHPSVLRFQLPWFCTSLVQVTDATVSLRLQYLGYIQKTEFHSTHFQSPALTSFLVMIGLYTDAPFRTDHWFSFSKPFDQLWISQLAVAPSRKMLLQPTLVYGYKQKYLEGKRIAWSFNKVTITVSSLGPMSSPVMDCWLGLQYQHRNSFLWGKTQLQAEWLVAP